MGSRIDDTWARGTHEFNLAWSTPLSLALVVGIVLFARAWRRGHRIIAFRLPAVVLTGSTLLLGYVLFMATARVAMDPFP